MNRQFDKYLQITLIALDLILLNLTFFISQVIFTKNTHHDIAYFRYLTFANSSWLLLSFFLRTYALPNILNFENFTKKIPQNLLLDFIFIIAQVSLTLCLYLNININFKYIYIGTYLVILYLVIKILYLVTWFIVSNGS